MLCTRMRNTRCLRLAVASWCATWSNGATTGCCVTLSRGQGLGGEAADEKRRDANHLACRTRRPFCEIALACDGRWRRRPSRRLKGGWWCLWLPGEAAWSGHIGQRLVGVWRPIGDAQAGTGRAAHARWRRQVAPSRGWVLRTRVQSKGVGGATPLPTVTSSAMVSGRRSVAHAGAEQGDPQQRTCRPGRPSICGLGIAYRGAEQRGCGATVGAARAAE